jgi:hypothetical protein
MNVPLPREFQRQRLSSLLLPLACLFTLSALAFTAVAQDGHSGRNGREDRGRGGTTVLATPGFLINTLPLTRGLCSVINLGLRPREATTTLRINHPAITRSVQASTIDPERFGGLDAGGGTGGRPVPPVRAFCEFDSSDVSLLGACVSVFDGLNHVPQYAPATSADPGDRHGRQASSLLATPPFTVAPSQLAARLVENLGATPQAATVTMPTDDGAPPRISRVTGQPDVVGGTEVPVNTQVSCEFESSNATALRASGTILDQSGNRSVRRIVIAL